MSLAKQPARDALSHGAQRMLESRALWIAIPTIATVTFWWLTTQQFELEITWRGQSPLITVYKQFSPELFGADYPSGMEDMSASLFMQAYTKGYEWFGISPELMVYLISLPSVAVLVAAFWWFAQTLFPGKPAAFYGMVAMMAMFSSSVGTDFCRYSTPASGVQTFLFYNTAEALRLLAISFFFRKQFLRSGVALGFCFMIHPIIGCLGALFLGGASLLSLSWKEARHALGALCLFVLLGGVWSVAMVLPKIGSGAEGIPPSEWFAYTHFASFHWYAVSLKLFGSRYWEALFPLVSLLLLWMAALLKFDFETKRKNGVLFGVFLLLATATVGIFASEYRLSPFLVKMALPRATTLVAEFSLIYAALWMWENLCQSGKVLQVFAVLLLGAAFLNRSFPILLSLAALVLELIVAAPAKRRTWLYRSSLVVCCLASALAIYYGVKQKLVAAAYYGDPDFWLRVAPMLGVMLFSWWLWGRRWQSIRAALFLLLVAGGSGHWIYVQTRLPKKPPTSLKENFLRAQLWARQNTEPGAIFMLDPVYAYGWRDYSRRGSFGNFREWIYAGLCYNSNRKTFEMGLERFAEFDEDVEDYLRSASHGPSSKEYNKLRKVLREKYYTFDDAWRNRMAKKYGVQYFVYEKQWADSLPTELPVAYENQEYLILQSVEPVVTAK